MTNKLNMKHWIAALRLRTLPLALSCIITGSACAYLLGGFSMPVFSLAVITTVLLQILSNLANDYGDGIKGTDAMRIGPERMIQSGKITPESMKKAIVILVIMSFLCGLALIFVSNLSLIQSIVFVGIGLMCIAAAIFYTVGKLPYGYRAMGDMVVLIFFGLVGVMGVFYLYVHQLNLSVLLPALSIGCLSAAVLHLNNMRDGSTDFQAGKITLANKLGKSKSTLYFQLLLLVAMIALFVFVYLRNHLLWNDFIFISAYPVLFFIMFKVQKVKQEKEFDYFLKPTSLACFLLSLLFALSVYL